MPIKCISCGRANLKEGLVQLTGKVRGETYSVEMMGLACPNCEYRTLKGPDMPEYGRLLADKYRAAHGWLTSDQIKERRLRLGLSQQAFADFLKRGVASVKRWELGRIQEPDNDRHIREMTERGPANTQMYLSAFPAHPTVNSTIGTMIGRYFMAVSGSWKEKQGCVICGQDVQRKTTSTPEIRYFSSSGSTSSFKVIGRSAYA